jgi:hypothetical protein
LSKEILFLETLEDLCFGALEFAVFIAEELIFETSKEFLFFLSIALL